MCGELIGAVSRRARQPLPCCRRRRALIRTEIAQLCVSLPPGNFRTSRHSDSMAEWSKAPDSSSGLARGVGSNPTAVTFPSVLRKFLRCWWTPFTLDSDTDFLRAPVRSELLFPCVCGDRRFSIIPAVLACRDAMPLGKPDHTGTFEGSRARRQNGFLFLDRQTG